MCAKQVLTFRSMTAQSINACHPGAQKLLESRTVMGLCRAVCISGNTMSRFSM